MEALQSLLKATPKSFFIFLEGIRKLVDRWTKCVAKQGGCAEGTMSKNKTQNFV
jgi:hypothetical protein